MMHAQRATLIQVGSCRVTNALLLLLAQALHFLLQEALALLLLVLDRAQAVTAFLVVLVVAVVFPILPRLIDPIVGGGSRLGF